MFILCITKIPILLNFKLLFEYINLYFSHKNDNGTFKVYIISKKYQLNFSIKTYLRLSSIALKAWNVYHSLFKNRAFIYD